MNDGFVSPEMLENKVLELENQLRFYRVIFEQTPDWKFFLEPNRMVSFSNSAMEHVTGFKKIDFLNGSLSFDQLLHPEDRSLVHKEFQKSYLGQKIELFEHRIIKNDKTIGYCESTIVPMFDGEHQFLGHCVTVRDITVRRKKEKSILNKLSKALINQQETRHHIKEQENILKRLSSNLRNGVVFQAFISNCHDVRFTFLSQGTETIYGLKPEDIIQNPVLYFNIINKDESDSRTIFNIEGELPCQMSYYELITNAQTGEKKWTYIIAVPNLLEDGIVCWDGVVMDHTELKNAQKILKQSEERFRVLFEKSPDVILIIDTTGKIVECNEAALNFYKCKSKTELLQLNFNKIYQNEEVPESGNLLKNDRIRDLEVNVSFCTESKDVLLSVEKIEIPDNSPLYISWQRDITEVKKLHNLLAINEERLRLAYESSANGICMLDLNGCFQFINPAFTNILGYEKNEILGKQFLDITHPEDIKKGLELLNNMLQGLQKHATFEKRYIHKSGVTIWASITISLVLKGENPDFIFTQISDITPRKMAEMALEESRQKVNSLIRAIPDIIFHFDKYGNFISFYQGQEKSIELFHQTHVFLNKNINELFDQTLSKKIHFAIYQTILEGKYENEFDLRINQEVKTYQAKYSLLNNDEVIAIVRDVSQQKKDEQKLIESQEKFSVAFNSAPYPLLITNKRFGHIVDCNSAFCELFEYSKYEISGRSPLDLNLYVQKVDVDFIESSIIIGKKIQNHECLLRKKSKQTIIALVSSESISINGEKCIISSFNDITKRKENEIEIKKLSTAVSQSPVAIVITDKAGTIEYVNPHFSSITGYSHEELIGKNPKVLKTGFHPSRFYENLWETILSGKVWEGEFLNKNKNGALFWEKASIAPIFNDKHEIINFLAVKEDITEHKNAMELLRENEEKIRSIFNSANVGIAIIDSNYNFTMFNQTWLCLLGYEEHEMNGHNHLEFVHKDDIEASKKNIERLEKKEINYFRIEKRYLKKDKSIMWCDLSVSTIKDLSGTLLYYTFVITDITAQKYALDARMLQAIIDAEEKERTRIAQELHDGVGPLLSSAKMYTQLLNSNTSKMNKTEVAFNVEELLIEAQSTVRQISYSLSPHILQNFGLLEALKSFAQKINDASQMKISISSNMTMSLNNSLETLLYRILCECLNNTIKHAMATNVDINFNFTDTKVLIQYQDDGIGFDFKEVAQKGKGVGLFNMINRLKMIHGKFDITSQSGKGVLMSFEIDL